MLILYIMYYILGDKPSDKIHYDNNENISMSDKISKTWAQRLNAIDPTQGSISINNDNITATSLTISTPNNTGTYNTLNNTNALPNLRIKPKWPDFLIDTNFDVIKINQYGQKLRRILKLNQHYLLSIKNGCEISKYYHYREVRRLWLENGDTIVVELKNRKQNYYMSPIAAHILQQVFKSISFLIRI